MATTQDLKERLRKLNNGEFAPADKPTGMITRQAQMIEVTIEELAAAIDARRDHPIAKAYRKTISENTHPQDGLLKKAKVVIDRVDLEALLDNKTVEVKSEGVQVEDGFASTVVSKSLAGPASAPENFDKVKPGK